MRSRLIALGYQGFGNLGDEAILTGIETLLGGSRLRVVAVLGGDRAPIAAFVGARRLVSRRLWPSPASVRSLAGADALLISGGGLLHDHWRSVIPRYLAWVVLARLLGRRVVWLGVGVGPLRRRSSRRLAAWATRLSDAVFVRDAASARLLSDIGGRVDGVAPDPAFFNVPAEPALAPAPGDTGPLGLIVRAPTPGDEHREEALIGALAELAARNSKEGQRVIVGTFAGVRDRRFAELVADRARRAGAANLVVEELAAEPAAGMAWLARCDAVVSVRLHGLILSALVGVPFVGVAYDDKVEAVLAELGASHLAVPLDEVAEPRLSAALDLARSPEEQARIAGAVAAIRDRQRDVVDLVLQALA